MTMADLHLDGNAVAGLLSEVFTVEATTALLTCGSCGATGAVATAIVYPHGPGVVMRCPACAAVVLRLARIRGRLVVDLSGAARVDLGDAPEHP
jgi:hypothetical protein